MTFVSGRVLPPSPAYEEVWDPVKEDGTTSNDSLVLSSSGVRGVTSQVRQRSLHGVGETNTRVSTTTKVTSRPDMGWESGPYLIVTALIEVRHLPLPSSP